MDRGSPTEPPHLRARCGETTWTRSLTATPHAAAPPPPPLAPAPALDQPSTAPSRPPRELPAARAARGVMTELDAGGPDRTGRRTNSAGRTNSANGETRDDPPLSESEESSSSCSEWVEDAALLCWVHAETRLLIALTRTTAPLRRATVRVPHSAMCVSAAGSRFTGKVVTCGSPATLMTSGLVAAASSSTSPTTTGKRSGTYYKMNHSPATVRRRPLTRPRVMLSRFDSFQNRGPRRAPAPLPSRRSRASGRAAMHARTAARRGRVGLVSIRRAPER